MDTADEQLYIKYAGSGAFIHKLFEKYTKRMRAEREKRKEGEPPTLEELHWHKKMDEVKRFAQLKNEADERLVLHGVDLSEWHEERVKT